MNASELRIGNWVRVYGLNPDGELKQIHSGDFGICELNPEIYEPIPLTEEWLLKFGFTMVCVPSAYGYDCNKYDEISNSIIRGAWNGKSWFALTILNRGAHREIKYVHTLQNLFYSLTGTELTINEGE